MKHVRHRFNARGPSSDNEFQAQNAVLRQKLDDLMAEARRNEKKLRRFEALELRLVGISSLFELVKAIIYPDNSAVHWDVVTLVLVDPEYEVRRMLTDEGARLDEHPALVFVNSLAELNAVYPHSLFPTLGPYRPGKHSTLFPTSRPRPGSVALLPLVRYGKLIGSLNVGSYDHERFIKGVRTDFFEHFAAIVAICIENAANTQRLKRQGLTDTLTAINNRRFFDQRLREEVEVSKRTQKPLSCMLLDVDYFKKVNDSYGHQIGDEVLREVAAIIRAQLRGSDVLSRYGGEEFAALLSKADTDVAEEVAERIRHSIEGHAFRLPDGGTFQVTISIGIASFRPAGERGHVEPDALVGHADRCLYAAKSKGRNRVVAEAGVALTPATV